MPIFFSTANQNIDDSDLSFGENVKYNGDKPSNTKATDTFDEGSFDSVVEGCSGVFHTTSSCFFGVKDPQAKSGKIGGQVCQICSDHVSLTADGEPFVAFHVRSFPVCRPCYEYERKYGTQSCPLCKTKYKRHRGSPAIGGEEVEDDVANNVSGELSVASPARISMASPESGIRGKSNVRLVDLVREFGSSGFGNVAWKERIDGWKIKPEKNAVLISVSNAPSEGKGGGDFDASTDVVMDDSIIFIL